MRNKVAHKQRNMSDHKIRNLHIMHTNVLELVESGYISIQSVPVIQHAKEILKNEVLLRDKPVIDEFDIVKKRHTWIFGESNTGKTTYRL